MPTISFSRARTLGSALALIGLLGLSACASVDVQTKPGSGFTKDSSFAVDVRDDLTATRAKLTSRLIGRGFNVIATLPTETSRAPATLPSRLRRVSNALPDDAVDTGFASRYVLEIDHAFRDAGRLGMTSLKYTRFAARMVNRATGEVVLSAVMDGGQKVNTTLDNFVEALDEGLENGRVSVLTDGVQ